MNKYVSWCIYKSYSVIKSGLSYLSILFGVEDKSFFTKYLIMIKVSTTW